MGLTNEAYSVIEKLTNSDPNNYENLWYLANIQYDNGEVDKAIATRLKISSIDKFNTRNHLLLMSYYKEKNNVIEMEKRFDKIMDIAPTSEDAKNAKALLGA
jgi:tetratricopeptide (TPR) repeat protein